MKKKLLTLLLAIITFGIATDLRAQTASTTINYTGFQACGGCTVCGSDYWCFNTLSSYCGNTTPCQTTNFTDPCPPGNIVTSVTVNYFSAECSGGSMTATIDGQAVPTVNEANTGCLCSNSPCAQSATSSSNYPCGLPGYVNGGTNTLQMCTGADVCINRIVLVFTYAPANQATPAVAPSAPSGPSPVCAGTAYNYSASSSNAATYTWTVPAGWVINSGQGTGTINATPGGAGNICVTAGNLCGNSAPVCTPVTITSAPSTPAAPTGSGGCSGSTQVYSTTGSAGATSYNWTVPAGSVINSGQGTTSINVTLGSTSGNVCVSASNSCGTSPSACLPITIGGVQATPGAPAGTAAVCNGSTQVYTTSGSAGATSYNWTVPAGTIINSGQGTTSINVTVGSSSGNVCVTATGPCGTSAAACTPITVTTAPLAPTSITGVTPVCPGNQNYSISSVAGATSYTWSLSGAGGSITGGQGTTAISTTWASAVTGVVSVTANNSCGASSPATFTVVVNPLPNVSITPTPTAVCPNGNVTLTGNGAVNYSWLGGTVPASGSVVSATPATTTGYTVTGTDANNCSNVATVTITVNPTPTVSISSGASSQTVCAGGTVNGITFTSNPAGTISWTNSNTSLGGPLAVASGSGNIPSYTAPNVGSVTTGVITIDASATGSGCPSTASTQATFTLTINPLPTITASVVTSAPCGQSTGCINSVTASGASPFTFSYNGGSTFSASSSTCSIASGTYPIEVKDNNGCILNSTIFVPSTAGPAAPTVSSSTNTACIGDNVTINVTAPVGSFTYTFSDAVGTTTTTSTSHNINGITPAGSYTVQVTATDGSGCVSSVTTTTITVNPAPTPPVLSGGSTNPLIECQGAGQSVSVTPSGTVASTPVWYSGTVTVGSGNTYTPPSSTPGTVVYTVVDSATATGCKDASAGNVLTVTVTVNPTPTGPTLGGGSSNPLVECEGAAQSVTVTPTGTVTSVPVWYNGTTTVATGTVYTPPSTTPGTTVYTVADSATAGGCVNLSAGNVLTVTVTVNPLPTGPTLGGGSSNPLVECQGAGQSVTVTPTGTVASTPVWYNGTTTVGTGNTFTPPSSVPGTTVYTVADSATTGGCVNLSAGNVLTVTVTVNPSPSGPALGGGSSNPLVECQGAAQSVTVTPTGTITSVPVWYSGTTTVATGTVYTPPSTTPGTTVYTVADSATVGGCVNLSAGNVLTVTVTVNPLPTGPTLGAGSSNPLVECQGAGQSVTVTPSGTVTSIPVWYNGTTTVGTGNTYTPPSTTPGTTVYTVADSATTGGCVNLSAGNVLTVTVTVNPMPTGPILSNTVTNPLVECQGSVAQTASVTPTGTVTSIPVWYNSSGATVATGNTHTPGTATPGTTVYTIADSATTGGCVNLSAGNVVSLTVTINPSPTAPTLSGSATNPFLECQTANLPVTVATTGTVTSIPVWYQGTTYVGSGTSFVPNSSTPGTTVYTVIDSATVTGCKDTSASNVLTVTVTVYPAPVANAVGYPVNSNCGNLDGGVDSCHVVSGTGVGPYHYQWYDATTGTPLPGDTLPTLTGVGPGTYSVLITDSHSCPSIGGNVTFTVTTSPPVVAGFTASPDSGFAPLDVTFTNTSSASATSFTWTLGNNTTTTTVVSPTYTYNNSGTYQVVLIASNGICSDTAYATIFVDIPTTIIIPNVFSPNGDSLNDVFFIKCTGMKSLTCDIFNRWGQKVYGLTGPNQWWDGKLNNGHDATEGTYYYMLTAEGNDGKKYTYQGSLTLVK